MKNQLVIGTDELFFGSGCAQLLEMIDLTGTITAASEAMHMSYSKAWKMLNKMEEELGDKVVVRSNGGSRGGRHLPHGAGQGQLLRAYRGMQQELSQAGRGPAAKSTLATHSEGGLPWGSSILCGTGRPSRWAPAAWGAAPTCP